MDQTLAWCGECCGLPIPYCRHCAYSACYAYQISPKIELKRFLTRMQWLVGVSTKWYLTSAGSGYIVVAWIWA